MFYHVVESQAQWVYRYGAAWGKWVFENLLSRREAGVCLPVE